MIEDRIRNSSKIDLLIVLCYLNVKVDETAYSIWPNATGRFGIGKTNNRDEIILELQKKKQKLVVNKLYNH